MKLDVSIDVNVCIEGKNVVLYVSEGDDIADEVEFSIYDLVHDYLSAYSLPTGGYHFDEDDKADIKALISELDDALTLAQETFDKREQ